jgi:TnpA family transposase
VDGWVSYTQAFTHAGGNQTRKLDLLPTIYASLLAQSGNFGLTQMTRMSDIGYQQLLWTTNWYLPLSHLLGGGTISSSDGQRFPVAVKTANATALPKYFGYGRGLTFYTWTSDQYSQFGTKVIPATMRDATVVLDEILDNETDLLGLQFAPRIRDLGDQCLYRLKEGKDHGAVGRSVARRRIAQARLGDGIAAHQQASRHVQAKHAGQIAARIRAADQDALHLALSRERRVPPADQPATQQRRGSAFIAPLSLRRQRGADS